MPLTRRWRRCDLSESWIRRRRWQHHFTDLHVLWLLHSFRLKGKKETYNAGWNPANCVAVMMVGPYRSTLGLLIKIMMTVDRNDVHGIVSTKQLSTIPLQGFKESSVDLCSALWFHCSLCHAEFAIQNLPDLQSARSLCQEGVHWTCTVFAATFADVWATFVFVDFRHAMSLQCQEIVAIVLSGEQSVSVVSIVVLDKNSQPHTHTSSIIVHPRFFPVSLTVPEPSCRWSQQPHPIGSWHLPRRAHPLCPCELL